MGEVVKFKLLGMALACLLATSCDPVRDIKAWNREAASQASVGTIFIYFRSVKADGAQFEILRSAIQQQTSVCARGPKRYDLRIDVDELRWGGSDKISATVKVLEPDTQVSIAEYYIQEVRGGVGIVGLVNATSGGADNARDFGRSICKRIFFAG
jgi:hypothetical protein